MEDRTTTKVKVLKGREPHNAGDKTKTKGNKSENRKEQMNYYYS